MKVQSIVVYLVIFFIAAPSFMAAHRQEPPEAWQAFAQRLESGAFIRVRLKTGGDVKGYFIPSSGDTFRVLPKTRIAVPIRDFQFSDINSIDRQHEGWAPGWKVLTGVAVGVGTAFLLLLAYAATD
jgi:hypothetical protein